MENNQAIRLFDDKQIRYVWDEQKEKYFFSVVDVIQVLTDSPRPRKYWNALKAKLAQEGSELSQNVGQLKLPSSDGKKYLTDVADTEQILFANPTRGGGSSCLSFLCLGREGIKEALWHKRCIFL